MVCDTYVSHAFKKDICRECGHPKSKHAGAGGAATDDNATPAVVQRAPTAPSVMAAGIKPHTVTATQTQTPPPTSKPTPQPITTSTPATKPTPPAAAPTVSTAASLPTASVSAQVNSAATANIRPAIATSTVSVAAKPVTPAPATAAPLPTPSTSTSTSAPASAPNSSVAGNGGGGCSDFVAHAYFPKKCRNCGALATAHTATAAPKTNGTAEAQPAVVPKPSAAVVSPPAAAEKPIPPPSSIRTRMASLGSFNPLAGPPAPQTQSATESVISPRSADGDSDSAQSSGDVKPVLKVKVGTHRKGPSVTALPSFTPKATSAAAANAANITTVATPLHSAEVAAPAQSLPKDEESIIEENNESSHDSSIGSGLSNSTTSITGSSSSSSAVSFFDVGFTHSDANKVTAKLAPTSVSPLTTSAVATDRAPASSALQNNPLFSSASDVDEFDDVDDDNMFGGAKSVAPAAATHDEDDESIHAFRQQVIAPPAAATLTTSQTAISPALAATTAPAKPQTQTTAAPAGLFFSPLSASLPKGPTTTVDAVNVPAPAPAATSVAPFKPAVESAKPSPLFFSPSNAAVKAADSANATARAKALSPKSFQANHSETNAVATETAPSTTPSPAVVNTPAVPAVVTVAKPLPIPTAESSLFAKPPPSAALNSLLGEPRKSLFASESDETAPPKLPQSLFE